MLESLDQHRFEGAPIPRAGVRVASEAVLKHRERRGSVRIVGATFGEVASRWLAGQEVPQGRGQEVMSVGGPTFAPGINCSGVM